MLQLACSRNCHARPIGLADLSENVF